MGLDTSHDCWHGSYSSFSAFRSALCEAAQLGPLVEYVGFGGAKPWPDPATEPLVVLLDHSDCEGEIETSSLLPLARRLEEVAPLIVERSPLPWMASAAYRFAVGCRNAAALGERVEFH